MKKFFFFLFSILFLSSCDDGDIIITSFEFDDVTLELCDGAKDNEYVFFKINPTNNEAISFNFTTDEVFSLTEVRDPISIDLAENEASLVYRKFNISVTNDYYCGSIPGSNIVVTEELKGTGGKANITTEIVDEDDDDGVDPTEESGGINPIADADDDEILNYQDADNNGSGTAPNCTDDNNDGICDTLDKVFDTDGDGIPNYKDQDDDNDNIPTSAELLSTIPNSDAFRDSDEDGTPDYLDNDDDNDGVPTINEDLTVNADGTIGNNNPRDDDTDGDNILNYLDADSTERNDTATPLPGNTVQTTFRTTLIINDIILDGNRQNFEEDDFSFGFSDTTIDIP